MNQPDIEKLRRFSLASGLVLITYFAAIVEPSSPVIFSVLGTQFRILNPKYIPIGIILASVYGMVRFILYGVFIERSPSKIRRQLRSKPIAKGYYEIVMRSKDEIGKVLKQLAYVYPTINKDNNNIKISSTFENQISNPSELWSIFYKPTKKAIILGRFHDIDYFAPIWLNSAALILACYRFYAS